MKNLFFSCLVILLSSSIACCQFSIALSSGTFPNIYTSGHPLPSFYMEYNGNYTDATSINSQLGISDQGYISWTLTHVSGNTTVTFAGGSQNPQTVSNSPQIVVTGCSGITTYTINAKYKYLNSSTSNVETVDLASKNFNIICGYPTGIDQAPPLPGDYCSFQLTPDSYTGTMNGYTSLYDGAVVEFPNTQPQAVHPWSMVGGPYAVAFGPAATYFQYSIDQPGWLYTYLASDPSTILVYAPAPPASSNGYPAFSNYATVSALGSAGAACIESQAFLPLQADYKAHTQGLPDDQDIQNIRQILASVNDVAFTQPTRLQIADGGNGLDLNNLESINLNATLKSEHPEIETIDWYVIDGTGKETLIGEKMDMVDVTIPGKYKAKVTLNQGSTVDNSGNIKNYSGDKYYIAESNILQVYNSSDDAPDVNSITVYPNPACQKVTVGYQLSGLVTSGQLFITNASTGTVVKTQSIFIDQQTQGMDIPDLSNGTYIVTLALNNNATSCSTILSIMCN